MPITVIERSTCQMLRPELEAALQSVATKYGVSISLGSASFSPDNVTFKLIVAVKSASGDAMTKEASDFKMFCNMYGMKPSDLHREFTYGGNRYKLLGCKPRSSRFPIIALKLATNQRFKLPDDMVKLALDKESKS